MWSNVNRISKIGENKGRVIQPKLNAVKGSVPQPNQKVYSELDYHHLR